MSHRTIDNPDTRACAHGELLGCCRKLFLAAHWRCRVVCARCGSGPRRKCVDGDPVGHLKLTFSNGIPCAFQLVAHADVGYWKSNTTSCAESSPTTRAWLPPSAT